MPNDEIKNKNAYNLNIPRYIDGGVAEDLQNIDGHLRGGIPSADVDSLSIYWDTFPNLQAALFKPLRERFYSLAVEKNAIRDTIYCDADFSAYADKVENAFEIWKACVDGKLRTIDSTTKPKILIAEIAEQILKEYEPVTLVDKYDAYEVLLSYWNSVMADDAYLLVQDGYKAVRDIEVFIKKSTKKKKDGTEETKTTETGWDGKLVPKALIIEMFFSAKQKAIDDIETIIAATQAELDEIIENAEDGSAVNDVLTDKGKLNKTTLKAQIEEIRTSIVTEEITALLALLDSALPKKKEVELFVRANPLCKNAVSDNGTITAASIKKRISEIRATADVPELHADDYAALISLQEKQTLIDERSVVLKDLKSALDKKAREQYAKLTDDQCLELLLNRKWYRSLVGGVFALYTAVNHRIAERVMELADRYGRTMPELENEVNEFESKVKSHLERMGFVW